VHLWGRRSLQVQRQRPAGYEPGDSRRAHAALAVNSGACATAYVQLHPMVYRRSEFGNERDSDLVALCQSDHQEYHRHGTHGNMLETTYAFIDERRQELQMSELLARI